MKSLKAMQVLTLSIPPNVALPEELTPLAEALEQAQKRVDQVMVLREAMETKVSHKAPCLLYHHEFLANWCTLRWTLHWILKHKPLT